MRPLEEIGIGCGYREHPGRSFHVGLSVLRQLRPLAECQREHAAIARLYRFSGDAADVETAASMFDRAGEGANAAQLRRMLPTPRPFPAVREELRSPAYLPTRRELLAADALDKAWVLAQLVRDEFACPPERIQNALGALEDAQRAWRECVLPICAGDSPGAS